MEIVSCIKEFSGDLAKGCAQCILGRKSVLFITGLCHYRCFYCPISDDKRNVDIVKINELVVDNPDSEEGMMAVIDEIKKCSSTGVGITGGDPLAKLERTLNYISVLKKIFGSDFHIHLYTSLPYVDVDAICQLEDVGLDEIRFHVDLDRKEEWEKLQLGVGRKVYVGVEIPSIPGKEKETKELLDYCKELGLTFVNLNELEYSDISDNSLIEKGFRTKNELSYGIKDSEELAKKLVEYGKEINLSVHYCSASFKDEVQLGNRLRLRAQNVKKDYDMVDEEGLLTRGEVRGENIEEIMDFLQDMYQVPDDLISLEEDRLLVASWVLGELAAVIKGQFDCELFIVTEYPTADHFIVEKHSL